MKERFMENGIEYVRNGDYYIPNLKAPEGTYNIGKYGRLHSIFIKENRPTVYSMKMLNGTWLAYLERIDTTAKEMIDNTYRALTEGGAILGNRAMHIHVYYTQSAAIGIGYFGVYTKTSFYDIE